MKNIVSAILNTEPAAEKNSRVRVILFSEDCDAFMVLFKFKTGLTKELLVRIYLNYVFAFHCFIFLYQVPCDGYSFSDIIVIDCFFCSILQFFSLKIEGKSISGAGH